MSYSQIRNKPFELASKSSHHHIINDPDVHKVLTERIFKPPREDHGNLSEISVPFAPPSENAVEHIIAVDGSYSEAIVEKEFPSRLIYFLQFGALYFRTEHLNSLEKMPFIAPEDMAKLKNIQRLKLVLPTKGVRFNDCPDLTTSVLTAIYEFFKNNNLSEQHSLLDTLAWFIFRRYKGGQRTEADKSWKLSSNPLSPENNAVTLHESAMDPATYTFPCPETGGRIHLTDVFRLHEVIDEEIGAAGIMSYLLNVIEHSIIIHIIRHILNTQPASLNKILFIKDGPTGFFGQTARMHVHMFELTNWLFSKYNVLLAGLEKSGAFVEYANHIRNAMTPGTVLVLTDDYIFGRILPQREDTNSPYASTSNYGHKVIFKTHEGQMHVVSLPVRALKKRPSDSDIPNLHLILTNIEKLRCDMYDSALFPVALVNKLVSLSAFPSQQILQRFASSSVA